MKSKATYKVLCALVSMFAVLSYAVECMASGDIKFGHRDYECEDLSQYRVDCEDEKGQRDGSCSGYNFREKSQLVKRVKEHRAEVIQLTPQDEAIDRKNSKQHAEKMQKNEREHLAELKREMKKNKENGKKSRERYIREHGGTLYVGEKAYRTIRIGTQNWMAEGLQQGACPDGWHIPSYKDWKTLIKFVENDNNHPFSELYAVRALLSLDDEWNVIDSSSAWDSTRVFSLGYYSEYKWMTYKAIHYGTDNYGFSLNKSGEQFKLSRRVKDTWVSVCAVDDRSGEGVTMRIYSTVTGYGGEGLPHIDNVLHFNEDKDCEMRCVEDDEEQKRLAQERLLEEERLERERLEQEKILEEERLEYERSLEQERLEKERLEQERLETRDKYIFENGGTFIDKRDGREYRSIQIGDRIWMAENLKFGYEKSSVRGTPEPYPGLTCLEDGSGCYTCLEDGSGCYYQWKLAQGQGWLGLGEEACPSGWRLPDTSDVNALFRTVGGAKKAAESLRMDGPDLYGFSLEHMPNPYDPDGEYDPYRDYGPYVLLKDGERKEGVPFWTSTAVAANKLVMTMFFENYGDAASVQTSPRDAPLPIRCVAKSEKKSGITWNRDKSQNSADDATDEMKKEGGKKVHWVPVTIFAGVAIAGGVAAYVFDQKAKDATSTPPMTAEAYQGGLDEANKNQTSRNISIGVMAAGLLALGITFLF